jgi:hypothetical protein
MLQEPNIFLAQYITQQCNQNRSLKNLINKTNMQTRLMGYLWTWMPSRIMWAYILSNETFSHTASVLPNISLACKSNGYSLIGLPSSHHKPTVWCGHHPVQTWITSSWNFIHTASSKLTQITILTGLIQCSKTHSCYWCIKNNTDYDAPMPAIAAQKLENGIRASHLDLG